MVRLVFHDVECLPMGGMEHEGGPGMVRVFELFSEPLPLI